MTRDDRPSNPIVEGLKEGLAEEASAWLKWSAGGAVVGAVILGGFGLVKFGLTGLALGAGAGAVLGGVGAWLFYLTATSLTG